MTLTPTIALPLTLKASGAVVEMGQSFDHRFHHSFELYAIVVPRNDHGGRPVHGEWVLSTETSLHGWSSMGKVPSLQRPSSAPAPPRGAPGGSVRPETPRARGRATGRPATASGARASRLEGRRLHRLWSFRRGAERQWTLTLTLSHP